MLEKCILLSPSFVAFLYAAFIISKYFEIKQTFHIKSYPKV